MTGADDDDLPDKGGRRHRRTLQGVSAPPPSEGSASSPAPKPSRPPPKGTLLGLPPAPPSDASPLEEGTDALDLSGPPLALPTDPTESGEMPIDGDRRSLELDLGELEGGQDAWARDRISRGSGRHTPRPAPRSTPPPAPMSAAQAYVPPPPTGGALDLVERRAPSQPSLDLAGEMADRYALGDFTGSLRAAEMLLGRHPDHGEARSFADRSRERLVQLYSARVGSLDRVPVVAVPDSELRWLGLDHRAGFLLSRIDGSHTVEEVMDVSGMPRLEVLKTLVELLDAGAIRIA